MSSTARRLDRSEPNKQRRTRAKPKAQLVVTVSMFGPADDDDEAAGYHPRVFKITRTRLRSEKFCKAHEDHPRGEDGYRWRCSCFKIPPTDSAARAMRLAGYCAHIEIAFLGHSSGMVEGPLPDVCARRRADFTGLYYVQLTETGEGLLRWRWAVNALRDQG